MLCANSPFWHAFPLLINRQLYNRVKRVSYFTCSLFKHGNAPVYSWSVWRALLHLGSQMSPICLCAGNNRLMTGRTARQFSGHKKWRWAIPTPRPCIQWPGVSLAHWLKWQITNMTCHFSADSANDWAWNVMSKPWWISFIRYLINV